MKFLKIILINYLFYKIRTKCMELENDQEVLSFTLICPECGLGNPENAEYCMVCERNLLETVLFFEDDSFDVEITKDCFIEYRKTFWGENRTGKVNKYLLDEMEDMEFGSEITRFRFTYHGKKYVLPLKRENMELLVKILK